MEPSTPQIQLVGLLGLSGSQKACRFDRRIGVISDTHGLVRQALAALAGVELIVHAGDVGSPEVLTALQSVAPVVAVRGNVDKGEWVRALHETEIVRGTKASSAG